MIKAKVLTHNGSYHSFSCMGHAGLEDIGKDIVCAAVSMLVINTANSLDKLTDNRITATDDKYIQWEFMDIPDEKGKLLMDSMVMGLKEIEKQYGNNYLRLMIEEV
ncbi:MAG TPA: ribosomal-processing cysteine protease Prp [Lachnospiraceae bacterium]|nr:ribosomal-processing cysteine protease Prp [Lachnospiraceae bacterium]